MLTKQTFATLLREHRFSKLFIAEMGWNNPKVKSDILLDIDDNTYTFHPIAERSGFGVFACQVPNVPTATAIRKIDSRLRRAANDYICIYYATIGSAVEGSAVKGSAVKGSVYLPSNEQQAWVAPVNTTEKREVIIIEYETTADSLQFLYEKVAHLSFDLTEHTTISDVRERIAGEFRVNGEKLTKDFYTGFRQEHKAFTSFITGIDDNLADKDNKQKQWYTSVMLNRLMFCYFIQKKGFLNRDEHYLRNKLYEVQQAQGRDRFFGSFYKAFLCRLFHDGLNTPQHNHDFEDRFGRIPYLNGGMFDEHQIEKDYRDIDIKDEAFERLFAFFDKWRWHLDYRQTSSGKDINPDVLGYIFEQYINDRAQMGAYYTKEDITGYISKNCIIPFLIDKAGIKNIAELTRHSGNRYLYATVCDGYTTDWQQRIPENIRIGIDTTAPDLLERRRDWNTPTPAEFNLPTEIWRETIERFQRCDSLLQKLRDGEIREINDFITYNLNITLFAQDILQHTEDHLLIRHFFRALQDITILDPTCGSGAFLFAAMNILEPLYEICLNRMEDFNRQNPNLFKDELQDIRDHYRSNQQYFIYKTIILRNLYGVDIMVEATEIAKLRLFLKMVAVVDVDMRQPNLGLDPLPDIDFNIRCGNTLVGYTTEDELNKALDNAQDILEELANQELKEQINLEMRKVADTFEIFKSAQLNPAVGIAEQKQAKNDLRQRLVQLNDLLNHKLFLNILGENGDYQTFLCNYQPFHWLAEFYQIIHDNHGFDVIIGNPPYVEYSKVRECYKIFNYSTIECGNLYAFVLEKSMQISSSNYIGMIIPTSSISTPRMLPLQKMLLKYGLYHSTYGFRPAKLFDGGTSANIHLSIILTNPKVNEVFSLHHIKWNTTFRNYLFYSLPPYTPSMRKLCEEYQKILRVKSLIEKSILKKISNKKHIESYLSATNNNVYYRTTGGLHYRAFTLFPTYSKKEAILSFNNENIAHIIFTILASNLWNMFYYATANCLDVSKYEIYKFPIDIQDIPTDILSKLNDLAIKLNNDIKNNSSNIVRNYQNAGNIDCYQINMRFSKPIIDEIDKVLAKHYGFTDEELDFIINYDIKYRMGSSLNEEE